MTTARKFALRSATILATAMGIIASVLLLAIAAGTTPRPGEAQQWLIAAGTPAMAAALQGQDIQIVSTFGGTGWIVRAPGVLTAWHFYAQGARLVVPAGVFRSCGATLPSRQSTKEKTRIAK